MKDTELNLDLYKINMHSALTDETRSSLDFVLGGLPIGEIGVLSASGGVGRSFFSLSLSFQICAGDSCNLDVGIPIPNAKPNKVMYISLEDNGNILVNRLQSIKDYWSKNLDTTCIEALADNIDIFCMSGLGLTLIDEKTHITQLYTSILNRARLLKPRLIIIDTLRRAHDCDENNNGAMSRVLRRFEFLAKTVNSAILLLHHENKSSSGSGPYFSRGASTITDTVRYLIRLRLMTEEEANSRGISSFERQFWIYFSVEKCNYSVPSPGLWLKRSESGVLVRKDPVLKLHNKIKSASYGWK